MNWNKRFIKKEKLSKKNLILKVICNKILIWFKLRNWNKSFKIFIKKLKKEKLIEKNCLIQILLNLKSVLRKN